MIDWVLGSRFWVLGSGNGALIGIRASACSARGQMISGTGPEAASKIANQGNYREAGTTVIALRPTGRFEHLMCGFLMWEGSSRPPPPGVKFTTPGRRSKAPPTLRSTASCRNYSDCAAAGKPPVTWNVERETWNQASLVK